jgi:hypothetical protein
MSTTSSVQQEQGGPGLQKNGATVYVDFSKKLPDLTPEEIKQILSPVLNFGKQRSAAVQFADSLPPQFREAIKNRIAAVGMDHETVIAAMGRPDRKVRERDADGNDTEDWIYGSPPGKTVFVTFIGDTVARVKQFP